jgi:hypothetical protein
MNLLECIDTLLEVDIFGWQLGLERVTALEPRTRSQGGFHLSRRYAFPGAYLVFGLAQLLLRILESPGGERGDLGTQGTGMRLWLVQRRYPCSVIPQTFNIRKVLPYALEGVHLLVMIW